MEVGSESYLDLKCITDLLLSIEFPNLS